MTDDTYTEVIGNSINAWDKFYRSHFDWVYKHTLNICHNTLKAKDLTDKLFAKVFLSHPELVVDNDTTLLSEELAVLFPYLGIKADRNKELSAGRLLHLYYHPN